MSTGTTYGCINTEYVPQYVTDKGTARARLSQNLFSELRIYPSNILNIELTLPNTTGPFLLLCTAWLDIHCVLAGNDDCHICIDSTVIQAQFSHGHGITWQYGTCKIIKCLRPRTLPSIRISVSNFSRLLSGKSLNGALLGMPIQAGYSIKLGPRFNSAAKSAFVTVLEPTPMGIVSIGSLITRPTTTTAPIVPAEQTPENGHYSRTAVVDKLISLLVEPVIRQQPIQARVRGVLLYGPPGTGKSYAVAAVQSLCRHFCSVNIFNISIVELLSLEAEQALSRIQEIFDKASVPQEVSMTQPATPIRETSYVERTPSATPQSYEHRRKSLTPETKPSAEGFRFSASDFSTPKSSVITPAKSYASRSLLHPTENALSVLMPELSLLLVDEIDALGSGSDSTVIQLLIKQFLCRWFDTASSTAPASAVSCCCSIVATSNRPGDIDPILRRGGRLEVEIMAATTNAKNDRKMLLEPMLRQITSAILPGEGTEYICDVSAIASAVASSTGGYSAADLNALNREVLRVIFDQKSPISLQRDKLSSEGALNWDAVLSSCFLDAARRIPPSALRGATITLPDISLDDVIGHAEVKRSLMRLLSFYDPTKARLLKKFHISSPGGALLHGPPGNSKTRLVLACASTMKLPVISLSVADIYSPYVGDAEAEIRRAFSLARQSAPCILFLDEVDAIVTNRATDASSTGAESRVLATMLTEIDGVSSSSGGDGILVLGATNRISCIDSALLRKGRFHHLLEVKTPTVSERAQILDYFCSLYNLPPESRVSLRERNIHLLHENDVNVVSVSGADIESICKEEAMRILREAILSGEHKPFTKKGASSSNLSFLTSDR